MPPLPPALRAQPPNGNTTWSGPDYLTPQGARILAERLEAYWREQGYEVVFSIKYEKGIATLRSNLVKGTPHPTAALAKKEK